MMQRTKTLDKKSRDKIHKANKFYDKYMAGKWNESEGEYNFNLSSAKKSKMSLTSDLATCNNCQCSVTVKDNTKSFICNKCNNFNSI